MAAQRFTVLPDSVFVEKSKIIVCGWDCYLKTSTDIYIKLYIFSIYVTSIPIEIQKKCSQQFGLDSLHIYYLEYNIEYRNQKFVQNKIYF